MDDDRLGLLGSPRARARTRAPRPRAPSRRWRSGSSSSRSPLRSLALPSSAARGSAGIGRPADRRCVVLPSRAQTSQSWSASIAANAAEPLERHDPPRGRWRSASGSRSAAAIQTIAPAAKPSAAGRSASNCSTKRKAGTASSGCGRLEKMLHPAAERTRRPARHEHEADREALGDVVHGDREPRSRARRPRRRRTRRRRRRPRRAECTVITPTISTALRASAPRRPPSSIASWWPTSALRDDDEERRRRARRRRVRPALRSTPSTSEAGGGAEHHPGRDGVRRPEPADAPSRA